MTANQRETTLAVENGADQSQMPRRRRSWLWLLALFVLVIVAGAVALGLLTRSDEPAATSDTVRSTAEVVRTDLVQTNTYDATLGRLEGEAIVSGLDGVLTDIAPEGATVFAGQPLYEVDEMPVLLMFGDTPMWRDLGLYEGATVVTNRPGGTITKLPEVGAVVDQGDVVYEVDGRPVIALYGEQPAYRMLSDQRTNLEGADVLQLETALVALGFDPGGDMAVDEEFTAFTATIVEDWQEAIGADVDGTVALGEVIFIPGPAVVTGVSASVGDAGNTPVLTMAGDALTRGADVEQLETGLAALGYFDGIPDGTFDQLTQSAVVAWQADVGLDPDGIVSRSELVFLPGPVRISDHVTVVGSDIRTGGSVAQATSPAVVVRLDLPAEDQGLVTVGTEVNVELPGGETAEAVVTDVSNVALASQQGAVFEVVIELADPSAAGNLDEAPVDVEIVSDQVTQVVAVPVSALLALAEGGYAVEIDRGGAGTELVAVDPGFFADGLVEVTGEGIEPGMRVVVP